MTIHIKNSGLGIKEELKEKIFEQGYTSDPVRGSGIGLATTKEYLALHNGSIIECGVPGKETHFIITIPKQEPELQIFPLMS